MSSLRFQENTSVSFENRQVSHPHPLSIGVLVLNHNTWDLALRALDAAIRLGAGNVAEYVLFDDGSTEPPPQSIDERIRVIRGESNRGFGGALPVAFAAMQSDIVVLFDSDACPLTPFASETRKHFENDATLGQLGFRAQSESGAQTESYFNEPTQWSLILGQALYARFRSRAEQPDRLCVITGCMATRAAAYADIGGFDPEFRFLDVDVDYSMRLRRKGWRVAVDPAIAVFHLGGGTPQLMRHRVLHFYTSRWRLLRKHALIPAPHVARVLILIRLMCEKAVLQVFGRLLFPDSAVRHDKLLCREELLACCRNSFR